MTFSLTDPIRSSALLAFRWSPPTEPDVSFVLPIHSSEPRPPDEVGYRGSNAVRFVAGKESPSASPGPHARRCKEHCNLAHEAAPFPHGRLPERSWRRGRHISKGTYSTFPLCRFRLCRLRYSACISTIAHPQRRTFHSGLPRRLRAWRPSERVPIQDTSGTGLSRWALGHPANPHQ